MKKLTGNPLIDVALSNRGIKDVSEIDYKITKILPVQSLDFVYDVADAILTAINNKKRIVVIADYDCDGVTAGALMIRMLKSLDANLGWLIPDRSVHGYGLTPELVDFAYEGWVNGSVQTQSQIENEIKENLLLYIQDYVNDTQKFKFTESEQILATSTHYIKTDFKPDIIVTVDNGIASVAGVERANELGLGVIVTDHHLSGPTLPNALAIVNPNHPKSHFESKALCGVGVAWYVGAAITKQLKEQDKPVPFSIVKLLPYVALGTVADVVTLDFNNRTLIQNGFNVLKQNLEQYKGIQYLLSVSNINPEQLATSHIGFQIGPRLNAAGRIANMGIGLLNLITDNTTIAYITAQQLDFLNRERKLLTSSVQDEALSMLNDLSVDHSNYVLVAYPEKDIHWHEGVIGIVAGRLKEDYNQPAIALTYIDEADVYKGSCRSIPCLNMKDLLDDVAREDPTILMKFGGHSMAAGLTIYGDKLQDFIKTINNLAEKRLKRSDFDKTVFIDYQPKAHEISLDNVEQLTQSIWGQNFVEPLFANQFVVIGLRRMGSDNQHLKLTLSLDNRTFDAVCFNCPDWEVNLTDKITLIYSLSVNEWQGRKSVNLMVKHYDFSKITVKSYS